VSFCLPLFITKVFINPISIDMQIGYNGDVLTSVVSEMLSEAIAHTSGSCIRFSARCYGYGIVLKM
jgi:hypothetical protein